MSSQEENKKLVDDLLSSPAPLKKEKIVNTSQPREKRYGGRSSMRFERLRIERELNAKKPPSNN
jgi:hypothetical protein